MALAGSTYSGTITAVSGDTVTVTADAYSTDRPFTCPYLAPGGAPVAGAACWLLFDERGAPLAFVPGAGDVWGPWTALPFDASGVWGNSPAPQVQMSYRVSAGGDVQVRGRPVVQAGKSFTLNSTGAVIATLPLGARPAYGATELRSAQDSSIGNTAVSLVIGAPGTITVALENTGRTMGCGAGTAVRFGYLTWSVLP